VRHTGRILQIFWRKWKCTLSFFDIINSYDKKHIEVMRLRDSSPTRLVTNGRIITEIWGFNAVSRVCIERLIWLGGSDEAHDLFVHNRDYSIAGGGAERNQTA
jgi:hypothetical protein